MQNRNPNAQAFNLAILMVTLQESGLSMAQYLALSFGEPQALIQEDDEVAAMADDEDEGFDALPFVRHRQPRGRRLQQNDDDDDPDVINALRISFSHAQPAAVSTEITDEDIVRKTIPFFEGELTSDEIGLFKGNLNKLEKNTQLELIQYLVKKYASERGFKQDASKEAVIAELDEMQVFGSLDDGIRRSVGKAGATISEDQRDLVRVALLSALKAVERTILPAKLGSEPKPKPAVVLRADEEFDEDEQKASSQSGLSSRSSGVASLSALTAVQEPDPGQLLGVSGGGPAVHEGLFANLRLGLDYLNDEEKNRVFLENVKDYVLSPFTSRATILDLFKELKEKEGYFKFIHHQNNPRWDRFRLFFKSNRNGPEEANFWHTKPFQAAVKTLKEAYLDKPDDLGPGREEEERHFIDYVRGNAPLHYAETDTRRKFSF
jgi:hypothetical protein